LPLLTNILQGGGGGFQRQHQPRIYINYLECHCLDLECAVCVFNLLYAPQCFTPFMGGYLCCGEKSNFSDELGNISQEVGLFVTFENEKIAVNVRRPI